MNWLTLTIDALAVYRLALLLSDDSGPWRMFSKFRSLLKREEKHNKVLRRSNVAAGVECIRCNSIWIANAVATYAYFHDKLPRWIAATGDIFLLCMALSSLAILLNRIPKR